MAAVPREAKIAAEIAAEHSVATSQRSSRVGCPTVAQRLCGGGDLPVQLTDPLPSVARTALLISIIHALTVEVLSFPKLKPMHLSL
jgi:hypothetical protein